MQKKLKLDISEYRSNEPTSNRISSRWSNDEAMIAIQGNGIKISYFIPINFISINI